MREATRAATFCLAAAFPGGPFSGLALRAARGAGGGCKDGRDENDTAEEERVDSDPGRLRARIDAATGRLAATAAGLTDAQAREPSRLPGWSRGHVLTHLARNADGLRNLLVWARTGVETPQYPSREAREAGIKAGAGRAAAVLAEDVEQSAAAFAAEAATVPAGGLGRAGARHERAGAPGLVHAVPPAGRGGDPPRGPRRGVRAAGLAGAVRRRPAGTGGRAVRRRGRRPAPA